MTVMNERLVRQMDQVILANVTIDYSAMELIVTTLAIPPTVLINRHVSTSETTLTHADVIRITSLGTEHA